ncbi:hypothetical protein Tco_1005871 [Tanacetum coccineum]|uniref:Uncharacterized protein n=1 Tax=Tanacetum coccineum TaxID=301880 RepID=A0ABQ5FGG3_9ASTR
MAGSKTSSLGILLVIQAKECHMDSKKAQRCMVFTLQVLSEKAQGVTLRIAKLAIQKLEEIAIITVNAECSAIIMNKVPEKLEDPRKFLIPGDVTFLDNLLSDDASYNLASKVISDHEPEQNESSITFSPRSDPLHHEFAGELLTLPSGNDREFGEYLSLMTMLCEILTSQSQENVHANQSSIIESLPVSPISVEDHTHTRHRTRRSGRVLLLVVGRSEG